MLQLFSHSPKSRTRRPKSSHRDRCAARLEALAFQNRVWLCDLSGVGSSRERIDGLGARAVSSHNQAISKLTETIDRFRP